MPGSEPDAASRARLYLVSEALRPAESTEHWQKFLAAEELSPDGRASFANALAGMRLVVAPTAHDEAEAIALILRSCIETPGKTAALVTPDRVLARRVAARLKRYDLAIDDSAGMPVARTVPGAFLDLVLGAVEKDFAPPELMALLKHPLALLGRRPAQMRARGAGAGTRRLPRRLCRTRACRRAGGARGGARTRESAAASALPSSDRARALRLVADLEAAFAPLTELARGDRPVPRRAWRKPMPRWPRHWRAMPSGSSSGLWQGDAGEALSVLLAELIDAGHGLALRRRRLSAVLSQPGCRRGGAPARGAASAAVHLGAARSAAAAARPRDSRQPQRRRVAAAAGGGPVAQPADARDARA